MLILLLLVLVPCKFHWTRPTSRSLVHSVVLSWLCRLEITQHQHKNLQHRLPKTRTEVKNTVRCWKRIAYDQRWPIQVCGNQRLSFDLHRLIHSKQSEKIILTLINKLKWSELDCSAAAKKSGAAIELKRGELFDYSFKTSCSSDLNRHQNGSSNFKRVDCWLSQQKGQSAGRDTQDEVEGGK